MKRRSLLASILAAVTAPALTRGGDAAKSLSVTPDPVPLSRLPGAEAVPLKQVWSAESGSTNGYFLPDEYESLPGGLKAVTYYRGPDPIPLNVNDAEFVPTGRWLIFEVVMADLVTMRDPYTVPRWLGWHGYAHSMRPAVRDVEGWLSREEAIAAMVEANRPLVGKPTRQWTIVGEVGEPQGPRCLSLELGPEQFAELSISDSAPVRVYRHRKLVS